MTGETLEYERRCRDGRPALGTWFTSSAPRTILEADHLDDVGGRSRGPLATGWRRPRSSVLLLNLEDLWLETESQNTPNTYDERPNWRRKLRRSFEQFADDPAIQAILKQVDELRAKSAR